MNILDHENYDNLLTAVSFSSSSDLYRPHKSYSYGYSDLIFNKCHS